MIYVAIYREGGGLVYTALLLTRDVVYVWGDRDEGVVYVDIYRE